MAGRDLRFRTVLIALAFASMALGAAIAHAVTKNSATPVLENQNGTATAHCPKGTSVIQGGFHAQVTPSTGTLVRGLERPAKRAWSAEARALGGDGSLTSTAYCGHGKKLSAHTAAKPLPANSPETASARCPKGTSVRLGGFRLDGQIQEPVLAGLERSSERTLRVTAVAATFNKHARERSGPQLVAVAYCGKGKPLTEVDDTVNLGNETHTSTATATATCAAGDKLAMGGYRVNGYDGEGPFISDFARGAGQSWTVSAFGFSEAMGPKAPLKITAIAYCKQG